MLAPYRSNRLCRVHNMKTEIEDASTNHCGIFIPFTHYKAMHRTLLAVHGLAPENEIAKPS